MSGVQLDKPADPFNTEGLAAPPRDGPATAAAPSGGIGVAAPMAVGEAKPAGVEFSADAGTGAGAGAGPAGADQPMTNLLGVVDAQATPTTAPAAAPALTAGSAAIDGNGKSDAAPVQATSAVGGAPAVPAPVPASATPPASDAAAGNVLGAAPAPAAAPSGDTGATKIGGGRPLGEAQAQAAKEPASPLQSPPIQEEEPRPAPSQQQQQQQQLEEPKASPTPIKPQEDNSTPPPRGREEIVDAPAVPTPVQSPPASAGVAASTPLPPAGTSTSGKALQDDFAKHWQGSGTPPVGDDEDLENDADSGAEKDKQGKTEGDTGKKEEAAVPIGVVVTTWTVGGQTYTGTATPRGGGDAAASTASDGITKSGDRPLSTAGGVQAAEKTGSGESDELKDEGAAKGDQAETRNDSRHASSPSEAQPTPAPGADQDPPTGDPAATTFSIDPSSSYTVITGSLTLTGQAAVSAIKAGATPLDAAHGLAETKDKNRDGGPGGLVIGGIVGGVVVVVLLGCWVWYRIRKTRSTAQKNNDDEKSAPSSPYTPSSPAPLGSGPRGSGSGRGRGNETDWTDSGFDFIDDPVSATSTQIRHRRATIANYYGRHGMPVPMPYQGGQDPFDDMNAREYAQAYGAGAGAGTGAGAGAIIGAGGGEGGQGGMEVMYNEKGVYPYDPQHQHHQQQHQFDPANPPQVGQVWHHPNPFADQRPVQDLGHDRDQQHPAGGEDLKYQQEWQERGPSPLQDLPLSPPPRFTSPNGNRSTDYSAPMTNPFGEPSPRYSSSHSNDDNDGGVVCNHLTAEHVGYQSRAATAYGDEAATPLHDPHGRSNRPETTALPSSRDDGDAYGIPLETGLPAKTPATGSLLPWLGTGGGQGGDRGDDRVPPAPADSQGEKSRSGKEKKKKKGKSKDKKRSRAAGEAEKAANSSPPGVQQAQHSQVPYGQYQYAGQHQGAQDRYDLVDPSHPGGHGGRYSHDPFDDAEQEVPHPVRAAMAATPAVAKMQMRQRNINEVPIPNFR